MTSKTYTSVRPTTTAIGYSTYIVITESFDSNVSIFTKVTYASTMISTPEVDPYDEVSVKINMAHKTSDFKLILVLISGWIIILNL